MVVPDHVLLTDPHSRERDQAGGGGGETGRGGYRGARSEAGDRDGHLRHAERAQFFPALQERRGQVRHTTRAVTRCASAASVCETVLTLLSCSSSLFCERYLGEAAVSLSPHCYFSLFVLAVGWFSSLVLNVGSQGWFSFFLP